MKKLLFFVPFIALLLLLNGCKSKNIPTGGEIANTKELNEFVASMQSQEVKFNTLSAKLNVNLQLPDKEMSSRVEMKLVKDSALQLSIQPILGIEIFRIELNKDSVKVMDRINKRYVAEGYSKLKEQFTIDFNFYNLQALFINQLFVPGYKEMDSYLYKHFKLERNGLITWLNTKDKTDLQYLFKADNEEKLLSTQIEDPSGLYKLIWNYTNFQPVVSSCLFPRIMEISFMKGNSNQGGMDISYSRIQLDRTLNMDFSIPAKYKRITFAQVLKAITTK